MADPYADAVAAGLRDALLCGMTAVEPATGDWRDDWHPRSRRAAFIGVVEEHADGAFTLVVLFRAGPRWDTVYGWRAVVWGSRSEREAVISEHPNPDDRVGSFALDLMAGIDGGGWELPASARTHATWTAGAPHSVVWVKVPA